MSQPSLLLAIPCYNCENQIPRVLSELSSPLLEKISEILIIDNCSTDKTLESAVRAVREMGLRRTQVIRNTSNLGLGGTHKVAFRYAAERGYDYLAILHGDNQAVSGELELLLEAARENPNAAAILGSRFMRGSHLEGYSKVRLWGNRALNALYTLITLRTTKDLGSGLNLFQVQKTYCAELLQFTDDITFNIDLLLNYISRNQVLVFYPITWRETDQKSNAKTFRVGLRCLSTLLRWRLNGARANLSRRDYAYSVVFSSFS